MQLKSVGRCCNMRIYVEDRLVQLKPKFTPEKPKVFVRPKHKSSDCSSEEIEDDHLCTKEVAKKSVKYYLQNTTLHGLKYIAEDKITLPERWLSPVKKCFCTAAMGRSRKIAQ